MASSRARHRASAARFAWAPHVLLSVATVPVGALAGCAVALVSVSAERPGVGLAGLAVAGLPLGLQGWRSKLRRPATRGRHALGVAAFWPEEGQQPAEQGSAPVALPLAAPQQLAVLSAPQPVALPARVAPAPVRLFSVSARQEVVEVSAAAAAEGLQELADQRRREVEELRQLWDCGTGPDTGVLTAVGAVPALADAAAAAAVTMAVRSSRAAA
jgi:hypothetical protein